MKNVIKENLVQNQFHTHDCKDTTCCVYLGSFIAITANAPSDEDQQSFTFMPVDIWQYDMHPGETAKLLGRTGLDGEYSTALTNASAHQYWSRVLEPWNNLRSQERDALIQASNIASTYPLNKNL